MVIADQVIGYDTERPVGLIRWVPKSSLGLDLKLQQQFEIIIYRDGRLVEQRIEWRDVPTEMNP